MFFNEHVWAVFLIGGLAMILFLCGMFMAQLIDIQHTGPWMSRAKCAIANTSEACPTEQIGNRGWLHSIRFLAGAIAAWTVLSGAVTGLIVHFFMDRML